MVLTTSCMASDVLFTKAPKDSSSVVAVSLTVRHTGLLLGNSVHRMKARGKGLDRVRKQKLNSLDFRPHSPNTGRANRSEYSWSTESNSEARWSFSVLG